MSKTEILQNMLEPHIVSLGFECWGVEFLSQGKHSLLRIFIESAEGITLQDCELVSNQLDAILDVEDPISSEYTLEVSSPGVDRRLFSISHFMRYIGSEIKVELNEAIANKRRFKAIINEVQNDKISLLIKDKNELLVVPFSHIAKASVSA